MQKKTIMQKEKSAIKIRTMLTQVEEKDAMQVAIRRKKSLISNWQAIVKETKNTKKRVMK